MIGCDVRKLDPQCASLLMNREVLAVNQDELGKPAARVQQTGTCEAWKKQLSDGAVAVALVNRGSRAGEITVKAGEVGLLDESKIARDLWTQQDIVDIKETLTQRLEPHQTVLLRVTGSAPPSSAR
jgi:alpha-galactosidase